MNRRHFMFQAGVGVTGFALAGRSLSPIAREAFSRTSDSQPAQRDAWRPVEITTRVDVLQASPTTRVWVPTPLPAAPYQKTLGDTYHAASGRTVMIETKGSEPDMLGAEWENGDPA